MSSQPRQRQYHAMVATARADRTRREVMLVRGRAPGHRQSTTGLRLPLERGRSSGTGSDAVPRLSYFYGIAIYLYYEDHDPPRFHARYGEHQVRIVIPGGRVLDGSLPRRAQRLVDEWVAEHRDELVGCWDRAVAGSEPGSIEPLT
jgi:Domain of unknown function (DUF4160)